MNIQLSNRLAALRRERGYSQEGLAAALGVSRQAVSKWERGESSPDTDNLIALARLYQISLDELLLHAPDGAAEEEPASEAGERSGGPAGEGGRQRTKRLMEHFPYPILVTALYLLLGFAGHWWHPGWLVFLTIPIYYEIVEAL